MELAVTFELGMQQGPMLLAAGRIVCFHAHIHTHEEILEIQTDAGAIGCRNLLIEFVELEHTALLHIIVLDGPDVTGIEEKTEFDDPEEFGAVFKVDVKTDVSALEDKVLQTVLAVETAGAKGSHSPSTHAVGAAAVEAFLKRQHLAVTIRDAITVRMDMLRYAANITILLLIPERRAVSPLPPTVMK